MENVGSLGSSIVSLSPSTVGLELKDVSSGVTEGNGAGFVLEGLEGVPLATAGGDSISVSGEAVVDLNWGGCWGFRGGCRSGRLGFSVLKKIIRKSEAKRNY